MPLQKQIPLVAILDEGITPANSRWNKISTACNVFNILNPKIHRFASFLLFFNLISKTMIYLSSTPPEEATPFRRALKIGQTKDLGTLRGFILDSSRWHATRDGVCHSKRFCEREMSQRNQQTTRANSRERICALVFNVTSEFTMRPSSAELTMCYEHWVRAPSFNGTERFAE